MATGAHVKAKGKAEVPVERKVLALLSQALELLDNQSGPLILRARLADIVEDLKASQS